MIFGLAEIPIKVGTVANLDVTCFSSEIDDPERSKGRQTHLNTLVLPTVRAQEISSICCSLNPGIPFSVSSGAKLSDLGKPPSVLQMNCAPQFSSVDKKE